MLQGLLRIGIADAEPASAQTPAINGQAALPLIAEDEVVGPATSFAAGDHRH